MPKIKINSILKYFVGAVVIVPLALIVNWLLEMIATLVGGGALAGGITLIVSALILSFAMMKHKGRESLPQDFVDILFIMGGGMLLSIFIPFISITYAMSIEGLAIFLAEAYLALMITTDYLKIK